MMSTPTPDKLDGEALGHEMYALIGQLYPICRSITGDGLRETLQRLQRLIPLKLHEISTGTRVFDWTVPREWNIHDAYVKNSRGARVIDFQRSNLHIVNYSAPIQKKMSLEELKPHLFTLPSHPDWIPYRTSYYQENWGFCLSHRQLLELPEDEYEVSIEASLKDGHLTYGELLLPGRTTEEILVSCHVCHPSLANDNLSGVAVASFLASHLSRLAGRFSYRFLFVPGTIGAITWLSRNESRVSQIKHGLVLAGVGDAGPLSYKKSRRGDTEIDRVAFHVLSQFGPKAKVLDFSPYGYDERQYCSPGFNLAVGRLSRTPHGTFPEYHTSADDMSFVHPHSLGESFTACMSIFSILERNRAYLNMNPNCEPQLGQRGLYRAIGGATDAGASELAMLWVLSLSDGGHTLLDIAERAQVGFDSVHRVAIALEEHGLLKECLKEPSPTTCEARV